MAKKTSTYDVWIMDQNLVYRQVPFTVVGDWIQEGRLLETDCVRVSGKQDWVRLADEPHLVVYLPQPEPHQAEDAAEAMETVELDISRGRRKEEEDDDVDMIPLIDISMVLLVFFMMTAQNLMTMSPVTSPEARNAKVIESAGTVQVTMKDAGGGRITYYLGDDYGTPVPEAQLFREVEEKVARGATRGIVKGDETLPFEKVQQLTINLERRGLKTLQAQVRQKAGE